MLRTPSRRWLPAALIALALISPACHRSTQPAPAPQTEAWPFPLHATLASGREAMVVSAEPHATEAGLDVLRRGGNAVDAAIATGFALAVTYPYAGNIGGGGFLVLRQADGTAETLDYRETAPAAATRDMYLDANGELTDRSLYGALAAGVPGSVRGLWEAHQRHGTRPWAELIEPAIRLAGGFEVSPALHDSLDGLAEHIAGLGPERADAFAGTVDNLLPGGRAPAPGTTLRLPELAQALQRIAEHGPDGFYSGTTADLIVAEMQRSGGIITHDDLRQYRPIWREPIRFDYRGHEVLSMPPASSGGVTLAEMANILEGFDLGRMPFDSAERLHLLAEAMKRAYADRNTYLGDPAFVRMPLERMISETYAAQRRADIRPDIATPSARVGPSLGPVDHDGQTTHYSIVDRHGTAVSVTTTINSGYGSLTTVRGAGFLLNNEMDDFAARPGFPNAYGLVQGEANAIAGGKRMLSSMTPSIVSDPEGRLLLVTGTPGGSKIITVVLQTILNAIDHGMDVARLVSAPRVHHQHLPDRLVVEQDGFSETTLERLRRMGHDVEVVDPICNVQAIRVLPDGSLTGAADPRRSGLARGY